MQLVFRYLFLEQSYVDLALSDFNYILLVIATVCVAAGGYVVNNIMDQETDEIAKPQNRPQIIVEAMAAVLGFWAPRRRF